MTFRENVERGREIVEKNELLGLTLMAGHGEVQLRQGNVAGANFARWKSGGKLWKRWQKPE